MIQSKNLLLSILLLAVLISGCATKANFNNTPINNLEFKKDFNTLKSNYSDIEKYGNPSISRAFLSFLSPDINELKKKWGKPDEEKKEWKQYLFNIVFIGGFVAFGQLPLWCLTLPFISVPTPPKAYIWNKEKYHISVPTVRTLFNGYTEQVAIWKWEDNTSK